MLKSNIPIGFGVITCDNMHQAKDRSSPNRNNKGLEAASACLEMMKLSESQLLIRAYRIVGIIIKNESINYRS